MNTYSGGCQCGVVRFSFDSEPIESGLVCNCSHCHAKGMVLHFIDGDALRVESGEDGLTIYNFNKKVIDHQFCKVCGVQPFGRAKDGSKAAINLRCVDDFDIDAITQNKYNGKDI